MLGYRPLVYFWIAEYSDGSALPQFDPETGKENLFRDVGPLRLKRFGWYPFTPRLAKKIWEAENVIVIPTCNKVYAIEIEKGKKLVAYRTNSIKLHSRSGIERGETAYVLGVENGKITQINENGKVIE